VGTILFLMICFSSTSILKTVTFDSVTKNTTKGQCNTRTEAQLFCVAK
jgi:hypothetical protein